MKKTVATMLTASICGFAAASNAHAAVILVDLGDGLSSSSAPGAWNNITSNVSLIENVINTEAQQTGIRLERNSFAFGGAGEPGGFLGDAATAFGGSQTAAANDFGYGTSGAPATLTFTNLDPTKKYTFTVYGSRNGDPVRTTLYRTVGLTTTDGPNTYETAHNRSAVVVLSDIAPSATGAIALSARPGQGNAYNYGWINAVKVEYAVPEPTGIAAILGGSTLLLRRRRRD